MDTGAILIYQNNEGNIKLDVRLEDETVWLTQVNYVSCFHGELNENSVVRNFRKVYL
jgi:hypothetical protein